MKWKNENLSCQIFCCNQNVICDEKKKSSYLPGRHVQEYDVALAVEQSPLFSQGLELHGFPLLSFWQFGPL